MGAAARLGLSGHAPLDARRTNAWRSLPYGEPYDPTPLACCRLQFWARCALNVGNNGVATQFNVEYAVVLWFLSCNAFNSCAACAARNARFAWYATGS